MFNDPALHVNLRRTGGKSHPMHPLGATHMRMYIQHNTQGLPEDHDALALAYMRRPSYFIDMSRSRAGHTHRRHGYGHHGYGHGTHENYGPGHWHAY